MAHPYHHALSSVKRWGGKVEDYLPIHQFFDESKQCLADIRHRALRHHAEGIFLTEKVFGVTLTNSDGKVIPVRWVGEQHVKEDLGWIPTVKDWLQHLRPAPWMGRSGQLALTEEERLKGEVQYGPEKSPSTEGLTRKRPGSAGDELPGGPDELADPGGLPGREAGAHDDGQVAPLS